MGGLAMSRGRSGDQNYDEIQAGDIVILAAGVNTGSAWPQVNIFRITCKLGFNSIMITCLQTNGTL